MEGEKATARGATDGDARGIGVARGDEVIEHLAEALVGLGHEVVAAFAAVPPAGEFRGFIRASLLAVAGQIKGDAQVAVRGEHRAGLAKIGVAEGAVDRAGENEERRRGRGGRMAPEAEAHAGAGLEGLHGARKFGGANGRRGGADGEEQAADGDQAVREFIPELSERRVRPAPSPREARTGSGQGRGVPVSSSRLANGERLLSPALSSVPNGGEGVGRALRYDSSGTSIRYD